MSWKKRYLDYSLSSFPNFNFDKQFGSNAICFMRKDHKCGKILSASKSCFVACPTDEELNPMLSLISEKLTNYGIETQIAIRERAYGQEIFCTKICGKIIESRFCLVILNDSTKAGISIPNPNVYYEYGLMTALCKHIIPLQLSGHTLAFNIQSHDTIKYTNTNLDTELDRAFKDAIRITDPSKHIPIFKEQRMDEKILLREFELAGFEAKGADWFLNVLIEDTDFKGFSNENNKSYILLGNIIYEKEFLNYLSDISVMCLRIEKEYKSQTTHLDKLRSDLDKKLASRQSGGQVFEQMIKDLGRKIESTQEKIVFMNNMYFAFLIDPLINPKLFIEKAKDKISSYSRFKILIEKNNEIDFEDVKVTFSTVS